MVYLSAGFRLYFISTFEAIRNRLDFGVDLILLKSIVTTVTRWRIGLVVGRWTCDQQVVGSVTTGTKLRNNLEQVVYTYVPLSPSNITWYWLKDGAKMSDRWREVVAVYRMF